MFEPRVMFFGLTNAPATFQTMMNALFRELIVTGKVVVYMDDILVFTQDLKEHRHLMNQVLQILEDNDLFLKPEKCFFERDTIEYLGIIIKENQLQMDPIKTKGLMDWPIPTKVKDVQSFLGFGNFYQCFIPTFSDICKPLHELTKKDHEWSWTPVCQAAFETLKQQCISSPVLMMPDEDKPFQVECDASNYAIGAILSQPDSENKHHPVAYLSKSMTPAEKNYNIYDKELLAVVKALEEWRHYLEGAKHQIEIWTDHKNLEYFRTAQKLNRRQARWSLWLSRFDYTLIHKSGITNKADALSRRPDLRGDNPDNTDRVLLNADVFHARATRPAAVEISPDPDILQQLRDLNALDDKVASALSTIKAAGPRALSKGIEEWNFEDGLILKRGRIYVPSNPDLRRTIIKSHHDPEMFGHPGEVKTLELIQRTFWWPHMSKTIKEYVSGCATCQSTKNITHPLAIPAQPGEIPPHPWHTITTDFITDLPPSNGYDSINVVVDRFSKAIVLTPCHKTITADQTAVLLIENVWRRYGLWEKIISDRGPKFAYKVFQAVCSGLGVRSALSSAYHPQTDGESERVNQELEQYLRAFCNGDQTNWSKLLGTAEFAHNAKVHSATGLSPYEVLMGRKPTLAPPFQQNLRVPTANDRLTSIKQTWEQVEASLHMAAEIMKLRRPEGESPVFDVGQQVWLEGKNLQTVYPKTKLAPKRFGPFAITAAIGKVNYRLKLPPTWRIHPVFHASLLTPFKETPEHGPAYERAPPDLESGEHEVEAIIRRKLDRRFAEPLRYFIKWKTYAEADNTWDPASNLGNAADLVEEFHQNNPHMPGPDSER